MRDRGKRAICTAVGIAGAALGDHIMTDTVLVVGAGPVGLTMALELARYKVPVRLVDKMTARSDKSRAIGIWTRTLEMLDRVGEGISAELISGGNKVNVANIFSGSERIAHIALRHADTPYPFVLMLPQCDTEAVLERHLEARGVHTELGVELTAFAQDDDGITAHLSHPDGRMETERFGWMVACDGSHSPIRHGLGLAFEGDTLGTAWALGDFRLTGSPFPMNELATYWHEDGPIVFFPLSAGRSRLIVNVGSAAGAEDTPPTPAEFQAIVDRRGPGGITLGEAIWTSSFRINERQVPRYRVGRVFLAGDAAHVHSPAGAQGMNTGMQDACNLAWKLALVCRGISNAPALLDSYDAERRPVGAQVIADAGRMTSVATLRNPLARHLRDAVGHLLLGLAPVQQAIAESMMEVSTAYPDSPLNGHAWGVNRNVGRRVAPQPGEKPYGAGDIPLFTLRAGPDAGESPQLIWVREFIDPVVRPNPGPGIELIRPDGYLALSAPDGGWDFAVRYLDAL